MPTTTMATPRSLRSFLDATPSDVLDTPFQSLIFIPRAQHDALLHQLASLQAELGDKQHMLNSMIHKLDHADGGEDGGFLASIDAEVQRTQVVCLEQKNSTLEREKHELVAAVEEAEAKARALKSEVVKLRNQQQQQQQLKRESTVGPSTGRQPTPATVPDSGWEKEKTILEGKNRLLQAEVARLGVQLDEAEKELVSIAATGDELSANYKNLQSENDTILEDRRSLQESLGHITEHNSQLYETTKLLESNVAALRTTNQELLASLSRHEEENKILTGKHHDLSDENARLEKESHRLQKDRLALGIVNDTLTESKAALESEVKSLQEKLGGRRDPDERHRLDMEIRIEKLLKERDALRDDLKRQDEELRVRQEMIIDLRKENKTVYDDRADLLLDYHELKDSKHNLMDENKSWRAKYDDIRRQLNDVSRKYDNLLKKYDEEQKKCSQLQKGTQILQARLTAARHAPRKDPPPVETSAQGNVKTLEPVATGISSPDTVSPLSEPLPTGPKRKALGSPRPKSDDQRHQRPTTPESNPEKRQKLGPPSVTTFKRKDTIYLVEVPTLANVSTLRSALAQLGSEVKELRRVFKRRGDGIELWVVKFIGVPKESMRHVYVMSGVYATLLAGSGTTCLICQDEDNKNHDILDCKYLSAESQDKPTPQQYDISFKVPPRVSIDTMPPSIPLKSEEQSPRSLFDRVSFPDGSRPDIPRRPLFGKACQSQPSNISSAEHSRAIETRINRLLHLTRTERRGLFCRFYGNYAPKPDQLLSIISGGPVEWVKIIENSKVGFVDFVYPADAARFLEYAVLNINGKHAFRDSTKGSSAKCTVKFEWSETAVKVMDPFLVKGIVEDSWARVLLLQQVPAALTAPTILEACGGGEKPLFWIVESAVYSGPNGEVRDVKLEFLSIREAEAAFARMAEKGFKSGLTWGVEDCVRPLE